MKRKRQSTKEGAGVSRGNFKGKVLGRGEGKSSLHCRNTPAVYPTGIKRGGKDEERT